MEAGGARRIERLELAVDAGPEALEALRLELRRLAERYGVELTRLEVDRPGRASG